MRRLLLGFTLLAGAACGGSSSSPSAPTPPQPAQLAGTWTGTSTTTSVSGGECFAPLFQTTIGGTDAFSATITQTGSSVGVTLTVTATGDIFTYSGTVDQNTLTLQGQTCSACSIVGAPCPGTSLLRDMRPQTFGLTGMVSGNTVTGTETENYNLFVSGTTTNLGPVVVASSISMTRR